MDRTARTLITGRALRGFVDGSVAVLLPAYLLAQDYRWIVFTATGALRQILEGFGAPLIELGRADPSSVATAADSWGRYYETDPRVFAGYLPDADRLAGFAHRTPGH